ncbi:MAG: hypothetical protein JSV85_00900 [Candidatus Bathyarchaeota archaeon]|nr:MAG: hypothetical protein JSV85_00900 [Candidatus Bathyarchaeota archaeon]
MITSNKGQIKTLEAFLAVIIIFSALILSTTFSTQESHNNQKSLATSGMQVLVELDVNGTLGKLINQRNSTAIIESLTILLPTGVSYNLTVYNDQGNPMSNLAISNGNLAGRKVESIQYLCASQSLEPQHYLLQLQLAMAG